MRDRSARRASLVDTHHANAMEPETKDGAGMFSKIRTRFTYANVAATLALVFAMSGGAYAASKYLITSTKQIKPSVLASLKGTAGKAGPAGAQGSAGPQGPAGSPGTQGVKGENGADGKEGAQGKEGPKGATGPTGATGKEGATGATGPQGPSGQTGFTETLPPGKTETGIIAVTVNDITEGASSLSEINVPISFSIPVEGEATSKAYFVTTEEGINKTGDAEICTGGPSKPTAPPGVLCVYEGAIHAEFVVPTPASFAALGSGDAYSYAGTAMFFQVVGNKTERKEKPGYIHLAAAWAVTAPSGP